MISIDFVLFDTYAVVVMPISKKKMLLFITKLNFI